MGLSTLNLSGIQPIFGELHGCMNRLRFPAAYEARGQGACLVGGESGGSEAENARALRHGLDRLNATLFCFATGLTPQGNQCGRPNVTPPTRG
jgi:hypothetical protein